MTAPALDGFLLEHAPGPPRPVEEPLLRARASIVSALSDLSAVGDDALERGWPWRDGEVDVRYGFYRQAEALEEARVAVRRRLAAAGIEETPARPLLGATTAARWALHGLLAGLSEADLDRDPGNGEWNLRQTLAHIVGGQRGYGWYTAWWLRQAAGPSRPLPDRVPEDVAALLPAEESEGVGSLADIRQRLDEIVDLSAGVFADVSDEALAAPARWMGMPVTVGFRIGRWSSHLREHTVQLEKTLGYFGTPPTEVQYLLRLVGAAFGRLEEELFMRPSTADGPLADALAAAEASAATIAADAGSVRLAAGVDRVA